MEKKKIQNFESFSQWRFSSSKDQKPNEKSTIPNSYDLVSVFPYNFLTTKQNPEVKLNPYTL